ncbi:hypothetical protein mRhiFer1_000540 [Rhinolophus ferrumequinum]|uniref:Uncharacterized protein n=1 Tax=Rhinolophus ferrumequinum TaxID=59479 RepID=A0A7J7S6N4_RHIFE|nr:hypothetical protein mRhiFer1_000540 [Rhinolophus ferrumequinum]
MPGLGAVGLLPLCAGRSAVRSRGLNTAEKTGTPPVPLQVPWAATLGDGPRDSAGRRQDEEVGQSRGALRGPSLRSRVGAGPRWGGSRTQAATPTSLNWDCGRRLDAIRSWDVLEWPWNNFHLIRNPWNKTSSMVAEKTDPCFPAFLTCS